MPTIFEQVDRFVLNEDRLENIVNGAVTSDVVISDGSKLPTLRKLFSQIVNSPSATFLYAMKMAGLSLNNKGDPGGNVQSTGTATQFNLVDISLGTDQVYVSGYDAVSDGGTGRWSVGEVVTPASFTPARNKKLTKNNRVTRIPKDEPVSMGRFGIDMFKTTDQFAALLDTLNIAKNEGYRLLGIPYGMIRRDGVLIADGVHIDWQGTSLISLSNRLNSMRVVGTGGSHRNLKLLGGSSDRDSALDSSGLVVLGSDIELSSIAVAGAAAGLGFASIASMFFGAKRCTIRNLTSTESKADGIHVTYGCEDLTFYDPTSIRPHDDGFASVSYTGDGRVCKNIKTYRLRSIDPQARGLSAVGGNKIEHDSPYIRGSSAAAVLVASEYSAADPNAATFGNRNVVVANLLAENCVTGIGEDANFGQAVIAIGGRDGNAPLADGSNYTLNNMDIRLSGRVNGKGARGTNGLNTDNPYNIRLHYDDLQIDNIVGGAGGGAVLLGGRNGKGRIMVQTCDEVPYVIQPSMTGDHAYTLLADDTRRTNPGIANNIHGNGQSNFDSLHLDIGQFTNAPGYWYGGSMDNARFTHRRFSFNGQTITR